MSDYHAILGWAQDGSRSIGNEAAQNLFAVIPAHNGNKAFRS